MKVCAVIVTYGDRFHLLKQVIDACFKEGVNKIIVVDNASEQNSRKQLKEYEQRNKDRLKVIYLNENTGSAGGYKRGLEEAYKCKDCEFIWLLDDDNMPEEDSLKVLKEFWNDLEEKNKEERTSLLSFRSDREIYKEAVMTNNPYLVLGRKNSFLGFHIIDLPSKILRVFKRRMGLKTFKENPSIKIGKVAVAPYGGMFFHKKLIDKIGYPREEFFLYADDHEWSYRITKNGGKIYLILESVIKDIDSSWNLKENKELRLLNFLYTDQVLRIYYSVRNRIVFEKENLVTCLILYYFNLWCLKIILKIFNCMSRNKYLTNKNLKAFNIAVRDGLVGKLGNKVIKIS